VAAKQEYAEKNVLILFITTRSRWLVKTQRRVEKNRSKKVKLFIVDIHV